MPTKVVNFGFKKPNKSAEKHNQYPQNSFKSGLN